MYRFKEIKHTKKKQVKGERRKERERNKSLPCILETCQRSFDLSGVSYKWNQDVRTAMIWGKVFGIDIFISRELEGLFPLLPTTISCWCFCVCLQPPEHIIHLTGTLSALLTALSSVPTRIPGTIKKKLNLRLCLCISKDICFVIILDCFSCLALTPDSNCRSQNFEGISLLFFPASTLADEQTKILKLLIFIPLYLLFFSLEIGSFLHSYLTVLSFFKYFPIHSIWDF